MNQNKSSASIFGMRKIAACFILFLTVFAQCRTLDQGRVGYVVPGGTFSGTAKTYTECGSRWTYFYFLDDQVISKLVERAEKDRAKSKTEEAQGFLWTVNINFMSPSCYTLSVYREN